MLIALLIALATGTGFHHGSAFDKQMALWLKKATVECEGLKTYPVDDQQMLKNIAELDSELKAVTHKYLKIPKNTTDMYNAGNTAGCEQNLSVVESIYQKLVSMKAKRRKNTLNKLFNPIQQTYADWLKAIQAGDTNAMNVAYQKFMYGFAKPYMASF